MLKPALLACASLCVAATLAAQERCTFDTAARTSPDSVILGLAPGWGERLNTGRPDPPDYANAAQAIRMHYQSPAQLRLPFWARVGTYVGPAADTSAFVGYGLDGVVRFYLDDTGHLRPRAVQINSASVDIQRSVAEAIHRADSAGAFAPPSRQVRNDDGAIVLHFTDAVHDLSWNVPLLRVTIPAIYVDSPPEMLHMPRINYPMGALRTRTTDRVVLRFVVQEDGRPDTSTIELVQASYRDFARVVLRSISDARFKPARIGACAVPVLVNVPIDFKIRQ